jgi:hypothetical protein
VKRASQRSSILLRETFDLNQPTQVTRTFLQPQTLPNQEDLIASSSERTFTGHFALEEINPPTIATGHSQATRFVLPVACFILRTLSKDVEITAFIEVQQVCATLKTING